MLSVRFSLMWEDDVTTQNTVHSTPEQVAQAACDGRCLDESGSSCWPYPFELPLGEQLMRCQACGAERDWLLIRVQDQIRVRCRCAHEWAEPRIGVDWYETYHGELDRVYPTIEAGNQALGFDGTFAGTYW